MIEADDRPLRAPHVLELAFDRSVGGVTAAFLAGLARGEVLGGRDDEGRVAVPPGEATRELVPVSSSGTVRAWSWVAEPDARHPLATPFAFALVQLDGADTALLHVVDVDAERDLRPGLRVRADWRDERQGSVLDIRAFVPGEAGPAPAPVALPAELRVADERRLSYSFEPGRAPSAFFRALAAGRIVGGRCPSCGEVHVPPHERCPACGGGPMAPVEVAATGTVVSFTVVHLPVAGLDVDVPFAWARILLDGADVAVPHVVGRADLDRIAIGRRVEAVWVTEGERRPSWEAIAHFRMVEP